MPNPFDEASKATENLFDDTAPAEDAPVEDNPVEDNPVEDTPPDTAPVEDAPIEEAGAESDVTPEQVALSDATNTAETAAQVAAEKDAQLQEITAQLEAERQANAQLQGTIDELSKKNEENIIEEALEPPVLDLAELAYADEDTQKDAQAKYAEAMAEYSRKKMMAELEPFITQAKEGAREKEEQETLSALAQLPELKGIEEMKPQLQRIIAGNKWLQSEDMPMDEKLINAFAIAKGVNSLNAPPPEPEKEMTAEDFIKLYNDNPAFQDAIEKQRVEKVKGSQQVPALSASSGAVNAALNIEKRPQSWDDASRRTREMFGMK